MSVLLRGEIDDPRLLAEHHPHRHLPHAKERP